jgi:hypothetical protein
LHFTHGSATTYAMTGSSHNRRLLASADARFRFTSLCLAMVFACRGDNPPQPGAEQSPTGAGSGTGYTSDIEKLCDVVVRAGVSDVDPNDRTYVVATWLASNLQTQEARKFLARIQPLVGDAKATALETEARRVGLTGCALAAEWRKPPAP